MTIERTLGKVAVDKLVVDQQVQRSTDPARVAKIVHEFNPASLGVIAVSHRPTGTLHVIDGGHRLSACRIVDHPELDAEIFYGLSLADEAAMFRLRNNTRQVSPIDKFRVRVVEGDPTAVAINTILVKYGWTVNAGKAKGNFAAVSAIEKVYTGVLRGAAEDQDTELVVEQVMQTVTQAWGHDPDGVRAELVQGIGNVFLRYNHLVDVPKLLKELGAHPSGPRGLVGKAKGLRDYRGGKLADAVSEIVVELLNKQKRTNLLPDWRATSR